MSNLFERLPKYIQIKEAIRKEIEAGILREGQQLASEAVLIERFGVSKMTVIRALQELVHEGFLSRVQGKGTYVTYPMRKHPLVGLMLPGKSLSSCRFLLQAIEPHASKAGFDLMLNSTDADEEKMNDFAERLIRRQASGLIAVPALNDYDPAAPEFWLNRLREGRIPVVLAGGRMDSFRDVSVIQTNDEEIMAELTREVIKKGHRRLLLLQCDEETLPAEALRIRGFLKAAKAEKIKVELAEVVTLSRRKSRQEDSTEIIALLRTHEPTAVMTLSDLTAFRVLQIVQNNPYRFESPISVTGYGDWEFAEDAGLTTVKPPLQEMGERAVKTLQKMMRGGKPEWITLPSRIVHRSSLSTLPYSKGEKTRSVS
ncbi:MAG TPA: GntR family transcriptional regulator [bacterium]|nr:GntR family transcriptional regulator [bacterium]